MSDTPYDTNLLTMGGCGLSQTATLAPPLCRMDDCVKQGDGRVVVDVDAVQRCKVFVVIDVFGRQELKKTTITSTRTLSPFQGRPWCLTGGSVERHLMPQGVGVTMFHVAANMFAKTTGLALEIERFGELGQTIHLPSEPDRNFVQVGLYYCADLDDEHIEAINFTSPKYGDVECFDEAGLLDRIREFDAVEGRDVHADNLWSIHNMMHDPTRTIRRYDSTPHSLASRLSA